MISDIALTGVRIQTDVEGGNNLDRATRPAPLPFAPARHRGSNQPAQSLEHPWTPEGRVAPQIPALADQSIGVPHILQAQQVRLCHRRIPLFRGIAADPSPWLLWIPLRGVAANVCPVVARCQGEFLLRSTI